MVYTLIRLDKYLCDMGIGTRSEVKKIIKAGQVMVDGSICKNADQKIDEEAKVCCQGKPLTYQKFTYILLNKPQGVITATKDAHDRTVMDLLKDVKAKNLSPVGRLDKDTEGLLLITNDGALSHDLLSPKKHVVKCYEAEIKQELVFRDIFALEQGVDIGDDKKTLPAKVRVIEPCKIQLSIMEGRFHQVKRMLQAVNNEVLALKRIRMGTLVLDDNLAPGEYRYLTEDEIDSLKTRIPSLDDIEAVLFDVDGSLIDSMWLWKKLDMEYLQRKGVSLPDDLQSSIEGLSFYETAEYFKTRFALKDSIEKIMDEWNQMAHEKYEKEVPLKKGVQQFLDFCKDKNIKMGVATSNSRELFDVVYHVHGLSKYISCVKTGSEVIHGKPAPDIYLLVAQELGVNPEKCLVFEDIIAGITAGKRAGMRVCAVQDAYSMDTDAEKHLMADFYIESYEQILEKYRI